MGPQFAALFSVVLAVGIYFVRGWLAGCTCTEVADLSGKNVIITGGTSGIGLETATILYGMGANLILPVRNSTKADEAVQLIKQANGSGRISVETMDLNQIASVSKFVDNLKENQIHILINNAGVWPHEHRESPDKLQEIFQTNHLSHFLLTTLLLPKLRSAGQDGKGKGPARVVTLSSGLHFRGDLQWAELENGRVMSDTGYESLKAYSNSKLLNVLFAAELQKRINSTPQYRDLVVSTSVHPGVIVTGLHREDKEHRPWFYMIYWTMVNLFGKSVAQGAQTTIYAAIAKDGASQGGSYFDNCAAKPPHMEAQPPAVEENGEKLWRISVDLLKKLKAPVRKIPL